MNVDNVTKAFVQTGITDAEDAHRRAQAALNFARPFLAFDRSKLAPFYDRDESGRRHCVVVPRHSEDGRVVRDADGRPVLVQFGNALAGTSEEQVAQALLALADAYEALVPGRPLELRIIFDMTGQSFSLSTHTLGALLRFPANVIIQVCGASSIFVGGWNVMRWMVPEQLRRVIAMEGDYTETCERILGRAEAPIEWGGCATWALDPPPTPACDSDAVPVSRGAIVAAGQTTTRHAWIGCAIHSIVLVSMIFAVAWGMLVSEEIRNGFALVGLLTNVLVLLRQK